MPAPLPIPQRLLRKLSPIAQRRVANFRSNTRSIASLWLFLAVLLVSGAAELVANDKPIVLRHNNNTFFPVLFSYPETQFGGEFLTEADYKDPYLQELLQQDPNHWSVWPPIRFSHNTINLQLNRPAPSPPSKDNWLGTDDQGRDVAARILYGLRLSIVFGLVLTAVSSVIGVAAGAVQGYLGGWVDLIFQRFLEIWTSVPQLYLLIILAAVIAPNFWTLLATLALFSWVALVGVVRAEFLRARNFEFVRAARALGLNNAVIIVRHVLPNAMVAALTFLPFLLNASITTLTSLDFLGFGLPPGSPSLGELLAQGKNNTHAPWLGLAGFFSVGGLLALLVFLGEGVRDAFDPRKNFA